MTKRFQFSLRAMAIAMAFIAAMFGAYAYCRNNDNRLDIYQDEEGQPVRFRLRLFRPLWKGSHRIGVLVSGDNYSWVDTIDYHRSWIVFWEAETAMALPPPGDYFTQTLPCEMDDFKELTQAFVVEPRE